MFELEIDTIYKKLVDGIPDYWEGKECIQYMKNHNCNQWRQMEWPGFYFQFMCENILGKDSYFKIPGPNYGNVVFDGFRSIPWDFKAHCTGAGNGKELVPTNGYNECVAAIDQYGTIGFIIVCGDAKYDDENASFKKWHDELKGGISKYEMERIVRNASSRRRKTVFIPRNITFVFINKDNLHTCGKFQSGMRNSDGTPRNAKVMLNLNDNHNLIEIVKSW